MKRYRLFSEAIGVRDLKGQYLQDPPRRATIPSVVIVIDELADLMMTAAKRGGREHLPHRPDGPLPVCTSLLPRSAPSADVITGLMKANIPSRIAFAVSSALESRIIR